MKSWWWGIGAGLVVSGCQLGTRWQTLEGDGFQVNFPGTPQQEQRHPGNRRGGGGNPSLGE
jgi:hypothetical protein